MEELWPSPVDRCAARRRVGKGRRCSSRAAELKDRLKRGSTSLKQVFKDAESDEILAKMKVSELLQALPRVSKAKAQEIMTDLGDSLAIAGCVAWLIVSARRSWECRPGVDKQRGNADRDRGELSPAPPSED